MSDDLDPILLPFDFDPAEFRGVNDIARVGLEEIAYIRPLVEEGEEGFGIFAADGKRLGFAYDRQAAIAAVLENDLVPLSIQ